MYLTRPFRTAIFPVVVRLSAAIFGGYLFTWGLVSLGVSSQVALGIAFEQAYTAMQLVAFLAYLLVLLWAFAAGSLVRVWGLLAGGGALMTLAGWLIQKMLV